MLIKFIGDLSIEDAWSLADMAQGRRVLEFGSGGSTQIFAQVAKLVTSVETDPTWIARTKDNLALLGEHAPVEFVPFDLFTCRAEYDVIFVDGVPDKRLEFAQATWPCLSKGGSMIFHDTRRFEYFREAAWVMQLHFSEISTVLINENDSNLTLIGKRDEPLHYVNWNDVEGKPLWAYGKADRPEGASLWPLRD